MIKYSFTKIDTYRQCKYKYKLKYVDKLTVYSSTIALSFGNLIHHIEEKIANCIKNNQPINYTALKTEAILEASKLEYKYKKEFFTKDKTDRTYFDKLVEYLESGIYRLEKYMNDHPTYKVVGTEVAINYIFENTYEFTGAIDRLLFDTATNTYIIHDIKTYKTPLKSDDLAVPLQLVVYSLAVRDMYNVDADHIKCQYDLPICDTVQNAGTDGYINLGIAEMRTLFDGINAKDFEPHPQPLCPWCEYCAANQAADERTKFACPYFKHPNQGKFNFKVENKWEGMEQNELITSLHLASYGKNINTYFKKGDKS